MKRVLRIGCCIIFSALFFLTAAAQEMLGIVSSNYSGINSSLINPSALTGTKYYLDINLVTMDIFADNNYIYLSKSDYKFSRFLSTNPQFPTHTPDNQAVYDYYNTDLKKAYSNIRVIGPSVLLNFGDHAIGLTTGFRTVVSGRNIPYEIAKFGYSSFDFKPQHLINYKDYKSFNMAAMSWAEIGLSYAYVFKRFNLENWSAGISVKRLMGVAGAYTNVANIDYMVLNKDTAIVYNLNAESGYSLPVDYKTNEFTRTPVFRGGGFGFDIGITYKKTIKGQQNILYSEICAKPFLPYRYKIGISVIDIGRITFKKNAQKLVFDNVSTFWPDISDFNSQNIDTAIRQLSQKFYGNPDELLQGDRISIGLPAALSVQIDVHYTGNWFVNGTFIYPLHIYSISLIRPAQLSITPRYESNFFEVNFPISLYDFSKPRIGISARLGIFTVGTDKLGGFFHYNDFTGMDVYFSVKIGFIKGLCKNKGDKSSCSQSEYKKFVKKK